MQARQTQARRDLALLADWYAENLRPKLARAVREGRVDTFRAAGLERTMADLLAGAPERQRRPREPVRETVSA